MGEVLCRRKDLAPWIGMGLTIAIQIVAIAYGYGAITQRQSDFDHRLQAIEASDKDQGRQLSDAAAKLARIESGVDYIREAVRDKRDK